MADGNEKMIANKKMCFTKIYAVKHTVHLCRTQYDKKSIAISFNFWALVSVVSIFDGKVVEPEFFLIFP